MVEDEIRVCAKGELGVRINGKQGQGSEEVSVEDRFIGEERREGGKEKERRRREGGWKGNAEEWNKREGRTGGIERERERERERGRGDGKRDEHTEGGMDGQSAAGRRREGKMEGGM